MIQKFFYTLTLVAFCLGLGACSNSPYEVQWGRNNQQIEAEKSGPEYKGIPLANLQSPKARFISWQGRHSTALRLIKARKSNHDPLPVGVLKECQSRLKQFGKIYSADDQARIADLNSQYQRLIDHSGVNTKFIILGIMDKISDEAHQIYSIAKPQESKVEKRTTTKGATS